MHHADDFQVHVVLDLHEAAPVRRIGVAVNHKIQRGVGKFVKADQNRLIPVYAFVLLQHFLQALGDGLHLVGVFVAQAHLQLYAVTGYAPYVFNTDGGKNVIGHIERIVLESHDLAHAPADFHHGAFNLAIRGAHPVADVKGAVEIQHKARKKIAKDVLACKTDGDAADAAECQQARKAYAQVFAKKQHDAEADGRLEQARHHAPQGGVATGFRQMIAKTVDAQKGFAHQDKNDGNALKNINISRIYEGNAKLVRKFARAKACGHHKGAGSAHAGQMHHDVGAALLPAYGEIKKDNRHNCGYGIFVCQKLYDFFFAHTLCSASRSGAVEETLICSVWRLCFTFFETVEHGRVRSCFKKRSRLAKRNNCAFPRGSLIRVFLMLEMLVRGRQKPACSPLGRIFRKIPAEQSALFIRQLIQADVRWRQRRPGCLPYSLRQNRQRFCQDDPECDAPEQNAPARGVPE